MASQWGMPLVLLNMGGEMIYILDQRLHAQNVPSDKAHKVIDDVVRAMLNHKLVAQLFKPQQLYTPASMRQVFDKLAHSSIMRLSTGSMDKLYDLMIMGFKHQVVCSTHPREVLYATHNHVEAIRALCRDPAVLQLIDSTVGQLEERYSSMGTGELLELRQVLCGFFQDKHVKVSLFLQDQVQVSEGVFAISPGGPAPPSSLPVGTIKYFDALGQVSHTNKLHVAVAAVCCPPQETGLHPAALRGTTLGTNMYLRDKQPAGGSSVGPASAAQPALAQAANQSAAPPVAASNTTAETAMAELNLLAELMGEAVAQEGDKGIAAFKLSMFNGSEAAADLECCVGGEVESVKMSVKSDKKQDNKELGEIMSGFDVLDGPAPQAVSYTHLRAHETVLDLVCRLLLEKKKKKDQSTLESVRTS
eukprot:TRINITY_DN50373_c0_g1_i1.p1 TRINITY_DN50373_c0_g1~~TRINITY_DN50373_c0_g1_i1.p1  ORF type:complete len:418 (-),score=126.32 TRINITY_DN50373_c0_g1_i1:9-1262(-)